MIELPRQDPCEFCEGMAGRDDCWAVVTESELTLTVINPYQFEIGQCCVITRRHAATLLDLTNVEGAAVIEAAREIALAMVAAYAPLVSSRFRTTVCTVVRRCRTTTSTSCPDRKGVTGESDRHN